MKPLRACSPIRRTSSHARRRKCRNLSRTEGDLAAQRSGLEQGVLVCLGAAGGVLPLLVAPAHEREAPVGGSPQRAQSAPGLGGDLCCPADSRVADQLEHVIATTQSQQAKALLRILIAELPVNGKADIR